MQEQFAVLAQADVFRGLDPETLESIASVAWERELAPAEIVYTEGSTASELFVVAQGEITLILSTESDGSIVLETRRAGEIFGETALWDQRPRTVTAMAAQASTVLAIPQQKIRELVSTRPQVAEAFLQIIASVVRRSTLNARRGTDRAAPAPDLPAAREDSTPERRAGWRPRYHETTHLHPRGDRSVTFLSIPRPPDLEAVTADLLSRNWSPSVSEDARALGLDEVVEITAEQVPAAVRACLARPPDSGDLHSTLEWASSAVQSREDARFVAELISEPLVPIEASPLAETSILALLKLYGGQAALGVAAVKFEPILLICVPASIVIFQAAIGTGDAVRELAYDFVRGKGRRYVEPASGEELPPS